MLIGYGVVINISSIPNDATLLIAKMEHLPKLYPWIHGRKVKIKTSEDIRQEFYEIWQQRKPEFDDTSPAPISVSSPSVDAESVTHLISLINLDANLAEKEKGILKNVLKSVKDKKWREIIISKDVQVCQRNCKAPKI